MNVRSLTSALVLVSAFFAAAGLGRAADAPAKADKAAKAEVQPVAAEVKKSIEQQPVSADVKKSIDQFNAKRDAMIANRQAMLDQLKNATADQKKAILEQMQAQQKDLLEAQRALGRQIRDELRKLRQSQPVGGR